jgi:hypothetical protein
MQEVAAATAAVSAAAKGSAAVDSGDKALAKRGRQIEKDLKRTFAGEETSVNTEQVLAAESLEAEWGGTMVAGMLSLCCVVVSPSLAQGRETLRRVLGAYAAHNEETGYCQSMNLVLAHLLLQQVLGNCICTDAAIMRRGSPPVYFAPAR